MIDYVKYTLLHWTFLIFKTGFDSPVWFLLCFNSRVWIKNSHQQSPLFYLFHTTIKKKTTTTLQSQLSFLEDESQLFYLFLPFIHSSRLPSTPINETATQEKRKKKKSAESKHNKKKYRFAFLSARSYPSGYVITNIYCMYWGLGDGLARTLSNHTSE